jgi:hypothetical protein
VVTAAATLTLVARVVSPVEAEGLPAVEAWRAAEVVSMVVGAGRFHHQLELSRPTALVVGRCVFSSLVGQSK